MNKGTSANAVLASLPIAIAVVLAVVFILPAVVSSQVCAGNELVIQPAVQLASEIQGLPIVTDNNCTELVQDAQNMMTSMNEILSTKYATLAVSLVCGNYGQFVPLLDSYNSTITSARLVNENNNATIVQFYENLFLMAANFAVVNAAVDFALYKISFATVGDINDGLGLATLRSICGNSCYSWVLHEIYQFIDNNLQNLVGNSETWASTLELPQSCSS